MNQTLNLDSALKPLLNQPSCHFVVAYSGGIDSEVLLHLMHQQLKDNKQHQLSAIHVNHGLNQSARQWQDHCQAHCDELGIKLDIISVDVSGEGGIEASARAARYAALSEHAPEKSVVLLAQHLDDQLETLLLQLKRGAGPKGLASMSQDFYDQKGQRFIRPILGASKSDIQGYAEQHALVWVEDDSNSDVRYERNFLRHEVIPRLTEKWPQLPLTASRSASLCAEQQALLDEVSEQRLSLLTNEQNTVNIESLLRYSESWQRQLIRYWLAKQSIVMPSKQVMDEVLKILHAEEDANPIVRWDKWQIRRFNGRLYVLAVLKEETNAELDVEAGAKWGSEVSDIRLAICKDGNEDANALCLGSGSEKGQVEIRFDQFNQRFKPVNEAHGKPLKQWFKVWKIPPWQRQHTPQIYLHGKLIAVWLDKQWLVSAEHNETTGVYLQASHL